MSVLGYWGSETVSKYIEPYSKWLVFAIFMALGIKFIYEAFQEKEKEILEQLLEATKGDEAK